MRLTREVRMALGVVADQPVLNSWSGWPATDELVPHATVRLAVEGDISKRTGMICDIKQLDKLVRETVPTVPCGGKRGGAYVRELWSALRRSTTLQLVELELAITPQLRFKYDGTTEMVTLVQQFEFAAAHRLHCDHLSDEENRAMFGKCNYPNGHGHNYLLEVSVRGQVSAAGEVCSLEELQGCVKSRIVDRFDHKHLNMDCEEFAQVNPTVENIARVCWQLLHDQIRNATLSHLRLYETPKTWVDLDAKSMEAA